MDPFARYLPAIEEEMRWAIKATAEDSPSLLYGMLRYHLGWADAALQPTKVDAGKRLRPILLLLVCEAQGGDWHQALPAAAAIELIHNFTLIHDDIEDRDRTRRGRPALWTLWGEAQAINAGDALFALAYRTLLSLDSVGLSSQQVLAAQKVYTQAIIQITEGQCYDLAFETEKAITEETYLAMIQRKTARLIQLTCELGGLIAQAPPDRIAALQTYGEAVGMTFQMLDDMLGLWGEPQRTGKPVGSDLRNHKKTLPIIHGLSHSATFEALFNSAALDDEDTVQTALGMLKDAGSYNYVHARASYYYEQALQALQESAGIGEAQEAIFALTKRLLNRDK